MASTMTVFTALISISGALTVFLCLYACIRRKEVSVPGARLFILYIAAQSVYTIAAVFLLASGTLEADDRWFLVACIGASTVPALGLLLVLHYIGRPASRRETALLFAVPAAAWAMMALSGGLQLFYRPVLGLFALLCLLASLLLLIKRWRHTQRARRLQLAAVVVGQFLPAGASFFHLTGAGPHGDDLATIVLCLGVALYIWAIVSTRLATIMPIARDHIFESMREGVVVLDSAERLIDFNAAAGRMLPGLSGAMIGMPLDDAWMRLTGAPFHAARRPDNGLQDLVWTAQGVERCYQLRSSPVRDRAGDTIGSLMMLIDVTEQRRLQERLKQLAYYDDLTKLLNRARFIDSSRKMLAQPHAHPVSIILFDIDRFKRINDTYGHETGDRAIRHAVAIVRRMLEPDMLFARFGGEEFVLALPARRLREAGELAERMRAALAAEPLLIEGAAIAVTASFGAAQSAGPHDTLETLLRSADAALYRAKREGRNRVRLSERR